MVEKKSKIKKERAKRPHYPNKKVKDKKGTFTRGGPYVENQFARRWSDEDLIELSLKIKKFAKTTYSMAGIALQLDMSTSLLYKLKKKYAIVGKSFDLSRQILSERAWEHGHAGNGFPNILQKLINNHDKIFREEEREEEIDFHKKKESVTCDEKIRFIKEIAEKIDDGNGNILDEFDEFLRWKEENKK